MKIHEIGFLGSWVAKDDPFPSLLRSRSGVMNIEFVFYSLSYTVDPVCKGYTSVLRIHSHRVVLWIW